jgi:hypothetical protein
MEPLAARGRLWKVALASDRVDFDVLRSRPLRGGFWGKVVNSVSGVSIAFGSIMYDVEGLL